MLKFQLNVEHSTTLDIVVFIVFLIVGNILQTTYFIQLFHRASICEGGLGSRNSVCPSVCPSVRLSLTRVDCDKS